MSLNAQDKSDDRLLDRLGFLVSEAATRACIQNVPPPRLSAEPRFTKGLTNQIRFELPDPSLLPVSLDSLLTPFVITRVEDSQAGTYFELPRPVEIATSMSVVEDISDLISDRLYHYSSALFLPKCLVDCNAVVDSSEIQLYCSAYADTVSSIQDIHPPNIFGVSTSQFGLGVAPDWWNQPKLEIGASASDPAGVWQAFLFRRNCGDSNWTEAVGDTTFAGQLTGVGYEFATDVNMTFEELLADGCYEFRVEGKDGTHTPESWAGQFELAGNGGLPGSGVPAQAMVRIDTAPPGGVELFCKQILNAMHLSWELTRDEPETGIGLAGYFVIRDGDTLATLTAGATDFVDEISGTQPRNLIYQVQPFDSLGNVQRDGGQAICPFSPVSTIFMLPEPQYTEGHTNQLQWTSSPDIDTYTISVARAGDFATATSRQTADTTFTFDNLSDGIEYHYWVVAEDTHGRMISSDTVKSVQDATFPRIDVFDVPGRVVVRETNWITQRNIDLELSGSDVNPGRLRWLEIWENGNRTFSLPIEPAAARLDTIIAYPVQTNRCQEIQLSVRILDAAGNSSQAAGIVLFLDNMAPELITTLQCSQLTQANGIRLVWQESREQDACSGLAGYRIFRNNQEIATVTPNVLTFEDIVAPNTPSGVFSYSVHPFDSVGNAQVEGQVLDCEYVGGSQIVISPMPEFTSGLTNTVCWEVFGELASVSVYQDADCNSVADDSATFPNPGPSQMCHTFSNLVDGRSYCYSVFGIDAQERRVNSPIVSSKQDNSPPFIESFSPSDAEQLGDQLWTYTPDLKLQLIARDLNGGEIWSYILSQDDLPGESFAFTDSLSMINEVLAYKVRSGIRGPEKVALSIQIEDGAGNVSEPAKVQLFLQDDLPPIFAFPNPFNPLERTITIRLSNTNENEVRIYDFFGNLVKSLNAKANSRDFVWDGRNGKGEYVANGGYICVGSATKARFKIGVMKR